MDRFVQTRIAKRKINLGVPGLLAAALLVQGCSVTHAPSPQPIGTEVLAPLRNTGPVAIVNVQQDAVKREFGSAGFGTLEGDLRSWTEAAVEAVRAGFVAAETPVQAGAAKQIRMAVTEVVLGVSGIDFVASVPKCSVTLGVGVGDAEMRSYTEERNAMSPPAACDEALEGAIGKAVADPAFAMDLSN